MGGTNLLPVADLNRPTLLAAKGGGSMGINNNGPGVLYVSNRRYFASTDGNGVIPVPVGGTFAADGSQDIYGMPAPAGAPYIIQATVSAQQQTSLAFPNPITSGSTLIAGIANVQPTSGDVPMMNGVTVNNSPDKWMALIPSTVSAYSSDYAFVSLWIDYNNNVGGQQTVTINGTNLYSPFLCLFLLEVGGLYSGTIDASGTGTADSTAIATNSFSSTQAIELWLGIATCAGAGGFTVLPASPWVNTEVSDFAVFSYQIRSATGTATYTATQSTAGEWAAQLVAIKPQFSGNNPVPALVGTLSSSITAPPSA